jgi:NAD(P)-dependent dehydrogenase (short-subunit alcohol dehydrogenase family)
MDLHLEDRSAIVTGSTAGIGLEIARKLAVEGAKVIITGRNKAKVDQAVDSIRTSGGAYVSGVLANAATEEGAAALVRAAPNADILVNNLGIYEMKEFAAITDADWRRYFDVNVLSGARLARAYFPGMLERHLARPCGTDEGYEGDGKFRAPRPDTFRRHHRLSEKPRQ